MLNIRETAYGLIVDVKALPRSEKTQVFGIQGNVLKVRINAQAEKGKANKELIEFLSDLLDIRKMDVEIIKGETVRTKQVLIKGIKKEEFFTKIGGNNEGTEIKY